jgi:hypothetical protein
MYAEWLLRADDPPPAYQVEELHRNGKTRQIHMPNDSMKVLQRHALKEIRKGFGANTNFWPRFADSFPLFENEPHRHRPHGLNEAAVRLIVHRNNRYFYLVDLADAFRQVTPSQVLPIIRNAIRFELENELLEFIAQTSFDENGELRVGAPTSPFLFDLAISKHLDPLLIAHCEGKGICYTRYVDDLVFSSTRPIGKCLRKQIRNVTEGAGYVINHSKCRVLDLQKRPIKICGAVLHADGRIGPPRKQVIRARGMLHAAIKGADVPQQVIAGHVGHLFSFHSWFEPGLDDRRLRELFDQHREVLVRPRREERLAKYQEAPGLGGQMYLFAPGSPIDEGWDFDDRPF